MRFEELTKKLHSLNSDISELLKESGYDNYDDLSSLSDYGDIKKNSESLQLLDEYFSVMSKLQAVSDTLEYFDGQIIAEGYLQKKDNGRYSLDNIEFSSGKGIEYLCTTDDHYYDFDEDKIYPYWKASRIEHDGTDYYIVGCKEDISTVKVRVRR